MGKNAIISVFDKTNLDLIANFLIKKKYTIYSTGGTSEYLKGIDIPHIEISKYTKQKEILDGRVKTLHPKIFGGLLGTDSKNHLKEQKSQGIVIFDILVINLYPFEKTAKKTKNKSKIMEMIDIGGHSLIRAAVKNYNYTIPITNPSDYKNFIKAYPLKQTQRKTFAKKAIQQVASYDNAIFNWFDGNTKDEYELRYGENPHQNAKAIVNNDKFTQLSGDKKLSYNNLLDLDAAVKIAYGVNTKNNICTIIKHNTPCGAAIEKKQTRCYEKALAGDPLSAFGGIVSFNKKVSKKTAELLKKNFYEVISAPSYEKEALDVLKTKKNLRIIKVKKFNQKLEERSFFGGTLIQDTNNKKTSIENINGINKLNLEKINFFVNVLKNIKSNAIALFDENSLISQSGGQTSRVDALQNCLYKFNLRHKFRKIKKVYLFSDAFFPFVDSLSIIKKQKIKIETYAPMGSKNDPDIRRDIKKHNLNFFKLSERHFKH